MKFLGLSVENVVIMIREQMPGRGLLLSSWITISRQWHHTGRLLISVIFRHHLPSPDSMVVAWGQGRRPGDYLAGSYIYIFYILQFLRLTMRAPSPLAATKLCPAARKSVSLCLDPAAQMSAHDAKFTPCSCVTAAITT